MDFNVSQLVKSPPGTIRTYDVAEAVPELDRDLTTAAPVTGRVKVTRTNRGVIVEARLETAIVQSCSRCTEPLIQPVQLRFTEEYVLTIDPVTGQRATIPHEPWSFTIDERQTIDLGEAIRQYALLELPLQPLCAAGCRGLCPECGQNLNTGACSCTPTPVDQRLARLAELLNSPFCEDH
ncbi:MAG: DUF177 domain-containing protein [Chloroflexi bacterium]|nr:DUF177 domain-containing protein [Chloroflexota bacterium]